MANTFKFGNGNWAVKDGYALAYNDENNNFKPLPFDFTRASSATRVNKQGLVEVVPSGKPRIDFTDNTSGHLLLEPSRTNIITNSEQFVDAPTGNTNMDLFSGTITNNNTTSPDGNTKGMKYTISSGSGATLRIYQSDLSTSADTTFTIYAKKGTANSFSINISGGTATSVTLTDEWQRITTTDTSNSNKFIDVTVTGSVGQYIYIFGMQAEAGSYATSYIPTEGSSVTRVADVNSKTSDEGSIIDSAKTIYIEFDELGVSRAERRHIFQLSGASGSTVYGRTESGGTLTIQVLNSSVNQALFQSVSYNTTGNNKLALTISENDVVLYVNGTQAGLDTNASIPTLYKMYVGISDAGTIPFAGGIKDCKLYDTRLTNTELQNLTS
jgi:hypothetical protein